jgi:hypothetical protein
MSRSKGFRVGPGDVGSGGTCACLNLKVVLPSEVAVF